MKTSASSLFRVSAILVASVLGLVSSVICPAATSGAGAGVVDDYTTNAPTWFVNITGYEY